MRRPTLSALTAVGLGDQNRAKRATSMYYAATNLLQTNILLEGEDFLRQEEPVFAASPSICLPKK